MLINKLYVCFCFLYVTLKVFLITLKSITSLSYKKLLNQSNVLLISSQQEVLKLDLLLHSINLTHQSFYLILKF